MIDRLENAFPTSSAGDMDPIPITLTETQWKTVVTVLQNYRRQGTNLTEDAVARLLCLERQIQEGWTKPERVI